jgi:hypothetical protein
MAFPLKVRYPVRRLKDTTFGGWLHQLWRVCTTTLEGSLSDTFKLVSSNDSDDARTSASGMSKVAAMVGEDDSYLDAVVVDNDDHLEVQALHQSDSSQRSGQGGSNSTQTGLGMHREFYSDDGQHYQGGFKSWILCSCFSPIQLTPWLNAYAQIAAGQKLSTSLSPG